MDSTFKPQWRDVRVKIESNTVEPQSGNCFICKEPGHRKRDCPVFKATLTEKGINVEEYQADYEKRAGTTGGGQNRAWATHARGNNGSGRGVAGAGRGGETGRGRGRGRNSPSHYGPLKNVPQSHAVSVSCIRCLQKGHLATECPLRVKQEQAYTTEVIDKSKIVSSYNGEINEEYSCFVCDVQGVVRNIIIFDSGCSRHMFSNWRMFKNISTDVDLWVKCANGSMTKVLGVGDVGILRRVLLVPQLKKELISEGQLAREMGCAVNEKDDWKRAINEEGDVLIEGLIQD